MRNRVGKSDPFLFYYSAGRKFGKGSSTGSLFKTKATEHVARGKHHSIYNVIKPISEAFFDPISGNYSSGGATLSYTKYDGSIIKRDFFSEKRLNH